MDKSDQVVKNVLMINGIADVVIAVVLIFFASMMGEMLGFPQNDMVIYLSGGWGVAALSFGALRIYAATKPEFYWFTAKFGLFEGSILTVYCILIAAITSLTFVQVSVSLLFAASFVVMYGYAFYVRSQAEQK